MRFCGIVTRWSPTLEGRKRWGSLKGSVQRNRENQQGKTLSKTAFIILIFFAFSSLEKHFK
jgi:hypothetical protein